MTVADRGVKLPRAMGHEVLGTIAKLGPDAHGLVLGDRRIVFPWLGYGDYRLCGAGDGNLCDRPQSAGIFRDGGMASFVVVRDARYLVDPGALDFAVACSYGCSGTTALNAIRKLSPSIPAQSVVVIGGLGLAAISILRALPHTNIFCIDIKAEGSQAATEARVMAALMGGQKTCANNDFP